RGRGPPRGGGAAAGPGWIDGSLRQRDPLGGGRGRGGGRPGPRRGGVGLFPGGTDERGVRTETSGTPDGHGRADSEASRLVRGGGDDATPLRIGADDDRAAPQLGVVALLDGCVERIHVDVEDRGERGARGGARLLATSFGRARSRGRRRSGLRRRT